MRVRVGKHLPWWKMRAHRVAAADLDGPRRPLDEIFVVPFVEELCHEARLAHTMQVDRSEPVLDLLQVDRPWRRPRRQTPFSTGVHSVSLRS